MCNTHIKRPPLAHHPPLPSVALRRCVSCAFGVSVSSYRVLQRLWRKALERERSSRVPDQCPVQFRNKKQCEPLNCNDTGHKRGNWSRIDQLILRASVSLSWKSQCRCIGQFFENPAVNVVSSCALRHRAQSAERHNNLAIIPHAQRVSERTLEIRYRHTQGKNTP